MLSLSEVLGPLNTRCGDLNSVFSTSIRLLTGKKYPRDQYAFPKNIQNKSICLDSWLSTNYKLS